MPPLIFQNKVFDGSQSEAGNNQVHTVAVYGGADKWTQQRHLRWGGGAHIVVATPGRLADFASSNALALNRVTYFVLDEADRMLDLGFQDEVSSIAKQCQPHRQQLFFSATWSQDVQLMAAGLCRAGSKPVRISYGQSNDLATDGTPAKHKAREGIIQEVVVVDHPGLESNGKLALFTYAKFTNMQTKCAITAESSSLNGFRSYCTKSANIKGSIPPRYCKSR